MPQVQVHTPPPLLQEKERKGNTSSHSITLRGPRGFKGHTPHPAPFRALGVAYTDCFTCHWLGTPKKQTSSIGNPENDLRVLDTEIISGSQADSITHCGTVKIML